MKPEARTKINELLKARGIQELDPDSMAAVSGGGEPVFSIGGESISRAEFDNLVITVLQRQGLPMALSLFEGMTGRQKAYNYEILRKGLYKSLTHEEYMQMELDNYWKNK